MSAVGLAIMAASTSFAQTAPATLPVVFDNFVWFSDQEIVGAVRRRIRSFDGTAPATAGVPEAIAKELQSLLQSKRIPGIVELLPQATLKTGIESLVFRVKDPSPKVCALRITGATAIAEADLTGRLALAGTDYSRTALVNALRGTLTDMYRQRGHWRVAFGPPVAALDPTQGCVEVTTSVTEGPPFTWDHAEWTGNTALASRELDVIIGMKSGEVASLSKLDEGLRRAQKAYGRQGYVLERATYTPRLDDLTRRAVFDVRVDEGPQFRMGDVEFPGLAPADAASLIKRWQLKPGDVFDASYPDRFMDEEIFPRIPRGARVPALESRADQQTRLIHVRFVFGG